MTCLTTKPVTHLVTLALLTLAAGHPAQAQQDDTDAAPHALKQVVVSASRSQAQVESMPLNTTIVSQEDIQRSSAQTLDQLLRDVPGLNFTGVPAAQSDPTGHQTKMRGLSNAKVLVLLDGVPLHDPFYLTTQWFKVPLSNIERVEVVRGGNSSLWGNMAVAGVINIVSKRPTDNSGEITLSAGFNGTWSGSASKNLVLSDTLSVNLAIDKLNSRGYATVPADQLWRYPARQPVNAQNTNVQVTTFFRPSSDLSGYVRIGQHIQDQDISYVNGKNLQTNPDIAASFTQKLQDKASATVTAWAQYLEFEKYNGATCYWPSTGTKCPTTTNTSATPALVNANVLQYYTQYGSQRYREQGASAIYSREMSGLLNSLQAGVDYRHLSAADQEYFYTTPTVLGTPQVLGSSTYGQAEQTFTGLFAQTKLVPTDALDITLSARFDSWDNTGRINTRTTAAGVTSGGAQPSATTTAFDPSLAARYAFNDALAVRGAVYRSFRAPGFNNTTRTFGSSTPTIANPDLTPENLLGRELGLDYNTGGLSLSATYFQYDIQNMIATFKVNSYATAPALVRTICASGGGANLTACGGSANFYTNDQDGQSYGLELIASWKANRQWAFNGAYTRTTSMLTRKGSIVTDPTGVQLPGIPQDVASVGATWTPNATWQSHLQARYIGSMNIDTTSTAGVEYKQADVTVLDASVLYRLSKNLDLNASVVNLLDTQYSENAYTYNQPWARTLSMPRTLTVGMKMRF